MKIYLVEDDPLQSETIQRVLTERMNAEVKGISTESEFLRRLDEIVESQPALIIVDVMLRWEDPSLNPTPTPTDYPGFQRAGVRCTRRIIEKDDKIPILLFSILEEQDLEDELSTLPSNVQFASKGPDPIDFLDKVKAMASL